MNTLTTKITQTVGKVALVCKRHAPTILTFGGLAMTAAGTVFACKATLKAKDILAKHKEDLMMVHECEKYIDQVDDEYSKEDYQRDLTIVYTHTAWDFVKAYAPAIIFTALGWAAIISSNNIARKRYLAMAAAYTATDKAFKSYRERVAAAVGKEVEEDIFKGVKRELVETVTTDENGKEKIEVKEVVTQEKSDIYTFLYDELNSSLCCKDGNTNLIQLNAVLMKENEKLHARGWLCLNEVLYDLGFRHLPGYGQDVGWINNNPEHYRSDGWIDFGIDPKDVGENGFWLHFNCDGYIIHQIDDAQQTY